MEALVLPTSTDTLVQPSPLELDQLSVEQLLNGAPAVPQSMPSPRSIDAPAPQANNNPFSKSLGKRKLIGTDSLSAEFEIPTRLLKSTSPSYSAISGSRDNENEEAVPIDHCEETTPNKAKVTSEHVDDNFF
jgi:hypothetical protein